MPEGKSKDNIENLLLTLKKFFIAFSKENIFYNEDQFSDIFLPKDFIPSLIQKVKDFYLSNKQNLDKIDKFLIR
ncbi:MAG: hypothetical protein ACK4GR_05060, partial [bacterium]